MSLYILGYLNRQPAYGYEIFRYLKENPMPYLSDCSAISASAVYYALHHLNRQSLIVSRPVKGIKAPERELYRISANGRRRLSETVDQAIAVQRNAIRATCSQYSKQVNTLYWLSAIQSLAFDNPHRTQYRSA